MPKKQKGKIKIIPLGGLNEVGKNLTVVEYENDIQLKVLDFYTANEKYKILTIFLVNICLHVGL